MNAMTRTQQWRRVHHRARAESSSHSSAQRENRPGTEKGRQHTPPSLTPALLEAHQQAQRHGCAAPAPGLFKRPQPGLAHLHLSSTCTRSASASSFDGELSEEERLARMASGVSIASSTKSNVSFYEQVSCILIPTRHELGESSTLWWSTDEIKGMRSRYVCEERLKRSISTGSSNNSTSTHNAPLKARNSRTVSAPCWNPFNPHHSQ